MKVKVLVVEPGKKPYLKEIEDNLRNLQKEVDGPIQAVTPFQPDTPFPDLFCYVNEEGKLFGEKPNWLWRLDGIPFDIIHGTFLVCADNCSGGKRSLTDEETEFAVRYFSRYRLFKLKDSEEEYVIISNAEQFLKEEK